MPVAQGLRGSQKWSLFLIRGNRQIFRCYFRDLKKAVIERMGSYLGREFVTDGFLKEATPQTQEERWSLASEDEDGGRT